MQGWVRLEDCLEKCVEYSTCEAFLLYHAKAGQMGKEYYDEYVKTIVLWCRIKTEKENFIKRWIRDHFELHFER